MIIQHNKDQIDVTQPDNVEVVIRADSKVVWVNVNGICMFRACRIKEFKLEDLRNETKH